MPKIYKNKDNYYFKIPAYLDMEECEIENKKYNQKNNPVYSDVPESMFSIMTALLIDFVEGEKPLELINWEWSADHNACKNEFVKLYKLAKAWVKYKERIEDEYLMKDWIGGEAHCGIWGVYEEKLTQLEDQFMRRLIDIRGGLWM